MGNNVADIQIRTGDLPLTKRVLYPTELCQRYVQHMTNAMPYIT